MIEITIPHRRPRRIVIISLLLTLQGISWLVLAVFIAVLGISTVRSAVASHKPTAASLTTAFAALGSGFFLLIGLFVLLLAWGIWRQKNWVYLVSIILEGLILLISLASFCGGVIWPLLAEGILAGVILVYLCTNHQVGVISQQ